MGSGPLSGLFSWVATLDFSEPLEPSPAVFLRHTAASVGQAASAQRLCVWDPLPGCCFTSWAAPGSPASMVVCPESGRLSVLGTPKGRLTLGPAWLSCWAAVCPPAPVPCRGRCALGPAWLSHWAAVCPPHPRPVSWTPCPGSGRCPEMLLLCLCSGLSFQLPGPFASTQSGSPAPASARTGPRAALGDEEASFPDPFPGGELRPCEGLSGCPADAMGWFTPARCPSLPGARCLSAVAPQILSVWSPSYPGLSSPCSPVLVGSTLSDLEG